MPQSRGCRHVECPVTVEAEQDPLSHCSSDRRYSLYNAIELRPAQVAIEALVLSQELVHIHLQRIQATVHRFSCLLGVGLRCRFTLSEKPIGVDVDLVTTRASQELVDRRAERLPH